MKRFISFLIFVGLFYGAYHLYSLKLAEITSQHEQDLENWKQSSQNSTKKTDEKLSELTPILDDAKEKKDLADIKVERLEGDLKKTQENNRTLIEKARESSFSEYNKKKKELKETIEQKERDLNELVNTHNKERLSVGNNLERHASDDEKIIMDLQKRLEEMKADYQKAQTETVEKGYGNYKKTHPKYSELELSDMRYKIKVFERDASKAIKLAKNRIRTHADSSAPQSAGLTPEQQFQAQKNTAELTIKKLRKQLNALTYPDDESNTTMSKLQQKQEQLDEKLEQAYIHQTETTDQYTSIETDYTDLENERNSILRENEESKTSLENTYNDELKTQKTYLTYQYIALFILMLFSHMLCKSRYA